MKNNIEIKVKVAYLKHQSDVYASQYAYTYTITITNKGNAGVQLLTRHWRIQDETGHTEDVIGEGVIGQQPHLVSGESFQYTSGAIIKTLTGSMKGSYGMVDDYGERFNVQIPEFVLSKPYTLH
ncbi:ApaG protein [Abyssogena phaseoliformis symbiont OG214]|uniref:Co2+/Mg2+ efflux protein ApaG n=1 Tax=Abyssogena phaseoliformis symbiont TaxID=596095 RepID=UPI00191618DE|nr:Co2+/Mg2+ efflux protein ApaG [Abyssogena phaseoliformis symbiont]MBW5289282.1 ApaG protein [Candidatus Ruthia sp. Apha_13_S6]BBB22693.1 ApaG protein [Abyssogena phaseoliformis symbiont OG214]